MNTRHRFLETLHYGHPDRFPYFDYTIRDDVLAEWRKQGLAPGADVRQQFHLERWERVGPHGHVELELRPLPAYDGRLQSRSDWTRLRRCYDPDIPRRYPADWAERVARWRERDHPLGLVVWRGFFLPLQVGDWDTLLDLLYRLHDDPVLVEEMMAWIAAFNMTVLERAMAEVEWDFALFEEVIASNHAPVISPAHYRRFCLPHLRRIADRVRAAGIDILVADSHGAVEPLIPLWLEAGLNTLWLGDVAAAGLNYRTLRQQYGRDLRLMGGLDLRVMRLGRAAVRREVMDTVPPLLEHGGYIPFLDGRIRKGMPFDSYAYYRRLLQELAQEIGS
jgi:uroporphyrinogen decarboxylase